MVQYFDHIPPNVLAWIPKQHLFCVATAPMKADGHVNVSPKSLDGMFHIVNPNQVWYEDLTGSGVETISHIRDNGRITIMFTAFDGSPNIVRLFGSGTVHEFGSPEYASLIPPETRKPGSRAAIVVDIYQVSTSCGYSIPFYEFKRNRTQLFEWASNREKQDIQADESTISTKVSDQCPASATSELMPEKGLRNYWMATNLKSIDGLPGITMSAPHASERFRPENLFKGKQSSSQEKNAHKSRVCGTSLIDFDSKAMIGLSGFLAGISVVFACLQLVSV